MKKLNNQPNHPTDQINLFQYLAVCVIFLALLRTQKLNYLAMTVIQSVNSVLLILNASNHN